LGYLRFSPSLNEAPFITRFRKPVNESPDLNVFEDTKQGTKKRRRINTEGKANKKKKGPPHSGFVMLVHPKPYLNTLSLILATLLIL
jgi:hypothetical protein